MKNFSLFLGQSVGGSVGPWKKIVVQEGNVLHLYQYACRQGQPTNTNNYLPSECVPQLIFLRSLKSNFYTAK